MGMAEGHFIRLRIFGAEDTWRPAHALILMTLARGEVCEAEGLVS